MAKACLLLTGVGHSSCLMSAVELSAVFLMAWCKPDPVSPGQSVTSKRSRPLAVRTARTSARVKEAGVPLVVTRSSVALLWAWNIQKAMSASARSPWGLRPSSGAPA
eukprot:3515107-Heterocapsa_arctica.AAC.1